MGHLGFTPIFMLVIGLSLLIVAITTLLVIRSKTIRCTKHTKGEFLEFVEYRSKRSSYHFPRVRYQANGDIHEGEARHFEGFGLYNIPQRGASVDVRYNPNDPEEFCAFIPAVLVQSNVMRALLCAGIVLCVSGTALLIV